MARCAPSLFWLTEPSVKNDLHGKREREAITGREERWGVLEDGPQ